MILILFASSVLHEPGFNSLQYIANVTLLKRNITFSEGGLLKLFPFSTSCIKVNEIAVQIKSLSDDKSENNLY